MGYMEEEKVIAGYDPVIMQRLFSFLKPYILIVSVAVAALILSTIAELRMPIVLQRTIDRYILVEYFRISPDAAGNPLVEALGSSDDDPEIDGYRYVVASDFKALSGTERDDLELEGLVEKQTWYVLSLRDADPDVSSYIGENPTLFETGDEYVAIPRERLKGLTAEDKRLIRRADIGGIGRQAWVYLGLLAGVLVFSFAQVYLMALTGQNVMKDIRAKLLSHVMRQSLSSLGRRPVGSTVTRVTNDVETINELFTNVATSLLKDFAVMTGVIITMFMLNKRLAVISILTLPPVLISTLYYRVKARDAFRRVRMWVSKVNAYIAEHVSGMDVVQMFGREKRSDDEFKERNGGLLKATLSEMYVFAAFRPLIDVFVTISIGVVIYFGAGMFVQNAVTLGVLIAFLNLIRRFFQPVQDMAEKFTILQSAMAGGERVFDILDTVDEIPDYAIGEKPQGTQGYQYKGVPVPREIRGEIEFRDVQFSYVEGEEVLKGLTFKIDPGESVAIVGYTGAGKTTIINLLARLWDIQSGEILLDGVDLREYPLSTLRRFIQPVQQDVFLFSGSVEENIMLGSEISSEEARKAAEIVLADRFVERLPHGYHTDLNEGATNISTGQRQLLSFARVIAHDPKIVVLDEATGSIDTETEKLIQVALEKLLAGRTSLVIAHRLSTIQHADRILVLSNGKLVQQGRHEHLIADTEGLYYNLYRLQYETEHN